MAMDEKEDSGLTNPFSRLIPKGKPLMSMKKLTIQSSVASRVSLFG